MPWSLIMFLSFWKEIQEIIKLKEKTTGINHLNESKLDKYRVNSKPIMYNQVVFSMQICKDLIDFDQFPWRYMNSQSTKQSLYYFPGPSWSYDSWIYNYMCNQCLSPLTLWVRIPLRRGGLDATLCDKVSQWLATGRWFSLDTPVSFTNKTDRHDIAEILLKVAINTMTLTLLLSLRTEWNNKCLCFRDCEISSTFTERRIF